MSGQKRDAVVVGGGPNGLAAALTLALHDLDVLLFEAGDRVGGGVRSSELTLPGFVHDDCSAVHPLAVASPLFDALDLEAHGLRWIHPDLPLAHPLGPDRAALLHRDIEETADGLGEDGDSYRALFEPLVEKWDRLAREILAPVHLPTHPLLFARFGRLAIRSAEGLFRGRFVRPETRALLAGVAAHATLPLDRTASAAAGVVLTAAAHAVGWPSPEGGAGALAGALESKARAAGIEIRTGRPVEDIDDLPPCRAVLLSLTPRQVLELLGTRLPTGYARALRRYRYGPAAYKVDWALDGPVPWLAEGLGEAGTVHLGGTFDDVAASEEAVWRGDVSDRPFVLFAQPSRFDSLRAPAGKHTAWAYCHVPNGYRGELTHRIESRVERFAPGFRDLILARHVRTPIELEAHDSNLVGGDINGGVQDLPQIFHRPVGWRAPYATPLEGVFICSSSTPPGGGVHGMCGYHAAASVLRRVFGRRPEI